MPRIKKSSRQGKAHPNDLLVPVRYTSMNSNMRKLSRKPDLLAGEFSEVFQQERGWCLCCSTPGDEREKELPEDKYVLEVIEWYDNFLQSEF